MSSNLLGCSMGQREKKPVQDTTIQNSFRMAFYLIVAIIILFGIAYLIRPIFPLTPTATSTAISTSTPSVTPTFETNTAFISTFTDTNTTEYVPTPTDIIIQTATSTDTVTATSTLTATATLDLHSTPTSFPRPVKNWVGTNLPKGFLVVKWRNDYIECDPDLNNDTVKISGVEIYNGNPPYEFTFWQYDNIYEPIINLVDTIDNLTDSVEFDKPVVVGKGKYVHVVLVFQRIDGEEATWIDDLYFPTPENNSKCN